MPNLIRQTLIVLRAEYYIGIIQSLFYLAGFSLLFWVDWKIGLGVLFTWWATMLQLGARKRT
jgi:hypothetical protein